jgi:hypothetical protein
MATRDDAFAAPDGTGRPPASRPLVAPDEDKSYVVPDLVEVDERTTSPAGADDDTPVVVVDVDELADDEAYQEPLTRYQRRASGLRARVAQAMRERAEAESSED